jgi:death-on-curing protein
MATPIRFLTEADVIAFQAAVTATWGGQQGVRDPAALAAAIGMAEQGFDGEYFHTFPFGMAAAYAFHIAEGQVFLDGNKRTGLMAALVFLRLNGITLVESDPHYLERAMLGLADKSVTKEDLAHLLAERSAGVNFPRGPWIGDYAIDDPEVPKTLEPEHPSKKPK